MDKEGVGEGADREGLGEGSAEKEGVSQERVGVPAQHVLSWVSYAL